jgi:2-keto-4-pentenoate hydratase/2-oxohepta-3-ene-1,7-dioic acid hydratase in catechol pathway
MRLAKHSGRAVIMINDEHAFDVETASDGRWGPRLGPIFEDWGGFREWASTLDGSMEQVKVTLAQLDSPVDHPRQIFAIGLNYAEHVEEVSLEAPDAFPPTFTKFTSSLTGPDAVVQLPPGGNTDWEVELVVVMGGEARNVDPENAWSLVAGVAVGQDLSERTSQLQGPTPQFSLGKSYEGFSPIGPWLVTTDELDNPDDLELGCRLDGETVQRARTSGMIFPVPALIAGLSRVVTLYPGDVIFTGTPSGVGLGRDPQRYIRTGQTLTSWVEGIGSITQRFA